MLISLVVAETTFFDNPDDVFIMSSAITGGTTEETIVKATGGGGCVPTNWECEKWGECFEEIQNRINAYIDGKAIETATKSLPKTSIIIS